MDTTSSGLPAKDVEVVRELAARVAELAALPVQQDRIREWQALNGLRPERPMAMIDEIPWHELASDVPGGDELAVRRRTRSRAGWRPSSAGRSTAGTTCGSTWWSSRTST